MVSTVVAQWFNLLLITDKVLGSIAGSAPFCIRLTYPTLSLLDILVYPYFTLNMIGGDHSLNFYPIISWVYHTLSLVSSGANIFTNYIL
jgi:hypothetical protein